MCWIEFQCDELAEGRESASQPDGAVSAEGSDFKNPSGSLDTCQQMKELAFVGGDVDGGKPRMCVGRDCFVKRLIGMDESVSEVAFDGGPEFLIHMVMRIKAGGCAGKLRFAGRLATRRC